MSQFWGIHSLLIVLAVHTSFWIFTDGSPLRNTAKDGDSQRQSGLQQQLHISLNVTGVSKVVRLCKRNDHESGHVCFGVQTENSDILAPAECLFHEPRLYGTRILIRCKRNLTVGQDYEVRDSFRHIGYSREIHGPMIGLSRYNLAVATQYERTPPLRLNVGKTSCASSSEECWIHKLNHVNEVQRYRVKISRCPDIDYFSCESDDMLCIVGDLSRFNKGDTGSPVVCQSESSNGTNWYLRGLLTARRSSTNGLIVNVNQAIMKRVYVGCVR